MSGTCLNPPPPPPPPPLLIHLHPPVAVILAGCCTLGCRWRRALPCVAVKPVRRGEGGETSICLCFSLVLCLLTETTQLCIRNNQNLLKNHYRAATHTSLFLRTLITDHWSFTALMYVNMCMLKRFFRYISFLQSFS